MFKDIQLQQYKGVLIDLDNTLYHYEPCHQAAKHALLALFCDKYGLDIETAEGIYGMAREKVHKRLHGQAACHSRLLYSNEMINAVFKKIDASFTLKMEEVYWSAFLNKIELAPEAEHFLEKCRINGIPIAIITDLTLQIQLRKFDILKLSQWIKYMISSEEAGAEKPSPIPFQLALEKLQLLHNEVIMIGDNEKVDKIGAEMLGIDWCHPF